VTVVFGPLFHAGPLMDLTLPLLLRGGRVVLGASRQFDPQQLLQAIARHRVTVVPIYPTMLRRVLEVPVDTHQDLSSLRLIITGGESAPIPVIEGVHRRFPTVDFFNNYGSTEGGPVTTFLAPELSRSRMGSVGKESFSVEVRIVDDQGQAVGPGVVGEIVVRSPFVCLGYWNRPLESAAQLRNGWWHTGDLAYRDADGFIWIAGRSKDMVKSGTENIYPIEVEQVIASLPGVIEVAVIGVPDAQWGESVVAYVSVATGTLLTAQDVVNHCRMHLASYKKPRHVVFVDSLPRGTTNKVAKVRLRQMWDMTEGLG
jgi:fatty-acyl-CoA synthase